MEEQDPDTLYSPSMWSKRFSNKDEVIEDYISVIQEASSKSREAVECENGLKYGPGPSQRLDIYGASTLPEGSSIFVFVHGGCWVYGNRDDSSYMVQPLYKAGIITSVIGYDLAPTVSVDKIVREIQQGIEYLSNWAEKRKSKIWLCGHSAGAHLISMALSLQGFAHVEGAILISGLYNLEPLLLTYVAADAGINEVLSQRNSPQTRIKELQQNNSSTKFLVVVGENDSPAFHTQSSTFNEGLCQSGFESRYLQIPDVDHFNIVTDLQLEGFSLTKEIIKFMKQNIGELIL